MAHKQRFTQDTERSGIANQLRHRHGENTTHAPRTRHGRKGRWTVLAKDISRVGTGLGLAGIMALSPYVSGKADAQVWQRHPNYTLNVQQDCEDFSGEGECFESLRDAVLEGNYQIGQLLSSQRIGKFSEIKMGEGDFGGENFRLAYPVMIQGERDEQGNIQTNLFDSRLEVTEATNRVNGIWLEDVALSDSEIVFLSEAGKSDEKNLRYSSGFLKNNVFDRTSINMFANSEVTIEGNSFVLGTAPGKWAPKDAQTGGIYIGNPLSTGTIDATLDLYGNVFIGNGTGPAISVADRVNVSHPEGVQGYNTFVDCNPVIQHNGEGYVDLQGNFYVDLQGKRKFIKTDRGIVEDKSGRIDARAILKKNLDTFGPPVGIVYTTESELRNDKIAGAYTGNVIINDNLQYVNPHEVTARAKKGLEGLTNLEHYLATGGTFSHNSPGFIGINSAYTGHGNVGKRTWDDVDGDGIPNKYDECPWDANCPTPLEYHKVPATSPLGLLGAMAGVGLAGAYALKKRGRKFRHQG